MKLPFTFKQIEFMLFTNLSTFIISKHFNLWDGIKNSDYLVFPSSLDPNFLPKYLGIKEWISEMNREVK